jgi:hypothetical protein
MDPRVAKQHGAKFVARYTSFDGEHPALTAAEAKRWSDAKVPLVAVSQTGRQERILGGDSVNQARQNGIIDAQQAAAKMVEVGAAGKPVYFAVDFNVTEKSWNAPRTDPTTGKPTSQGALVRAYFEGVRSVLPKGQTGVYGSNTTVDKLFDAGKIRYGWQMTFNKRGNVTDARAQLHQFDIFPSQDGWGVNGAGALDFDRAVRREFGQWRSTL